MTEQEMIDFINAAIIDYAKEHHPHHQPPTDPAPVLAFFQRLLALLPTRSTRKKHHHKHHTHTGKGKSK